ncbi:MAG: branched-chain amino acid ABC transporter ATP-binding protein/permease [Rhodospirillales bacterium]|nr:branched-chain amino acid ABC transporter ATP-binding protein/permease [Rhodospirillales bacterium]
MPELARRCLAPVVLLVAALAIMAPAFQGGGYALRLATLAAIQAILAIGYQTVFGRLGLLSLAQGAFFGIGAYATAFAATRFGVDASLTLPIAIAAATGIAAIVALPVLRLASHYLALATLGLAQLALLAAVNLEAITGGALGINNVPGLELGGQAIARGWPLMATCWALAALVAVAAWYRASGLRGQAMDLAREDPVAAEALGIDTRVLRLKAFLFAAAAAGLAGALHAHLLGIVSPEVLEFPVMVACLSMVVIGGRFSVAGAILGAVLVVHLPEYLRITGAWYLAIYGAAMLAMILFAPEGIAGMAGRLVRRFVPARTAPLPRPIAPPAPQRAIGAKPILALRGVTKRFGGVVALARVDLKIAPGELVGVIGPNGSGKTTLINTIAGLYKPDEGTIRLDAEDVAGARVFKVARAGVARGFQAPRLMDDRSVLDNVALAVRDAGAAEGRAVYWLDRLGLADIAHRRSGDLPGGKRRLVEIARAMAASPRLLLLDEPAAGLTPAEQATLAATLGDLNREGLAILVVEHSVAFLSALTPRLVCLVEGRVVADGPAERVIADPRVVEAYLGGRERRRA